MMAAGLRLALILIVLVSLWLFTAHPWWFPVGASSAAPAVDRQFRIAWWLLGTLFVAAQILLAILIKSPRDNAAARWWRGHWRLELAWAMIITAVLFWFHLSGDFLWSQVGHHSAIPAGETHVEITGVQFQWYFRYPGPDGILGRVNAQKFARPDEGNPLGIDPSDPAGRDDIVSSTLVLPVNQPVELELRAQDVIHSVFIPEMRFKQDAVPGMDIRYQILPTRLGNYEIACAELCGLGHYRMRAAVRVVSEEEFLRWLQSQREIAGVQ
jgi:cytochrome c oxidase subunit II